MSPHQVMGVRPDATADEIRRRYRQLARTCHPDRGGDPREFVRLQQAYEAMLAALDNPRPPVVETPPSTSPFEMPAQEEPTRTRPTWMDEYDEPAERRRGASRDESRKNLHGEQPRDHTFIVLAVATLGAALGVSLASAMKSGGMDLGMTIGQTVLFAVVLMLVGGGGAAVGAGSNVKSFVETYLWIVAGLTIMLIVVSPLPFLKPDAIPNSASKAASAIPPRAEP
jgi:hypothetical protein